MSQQQILQYLFGLLYVQNGSNKVIVDIFIKYMNQYLVTIALINGMIGGLILVLPITAMAGGSVLSFLVILITGFFSFYSCYLCLLHLGKHSDLDKAILEHFNQSKVIRIFYDLLVFLNLLLLLMLYFNLIVTQWRGLLPYHIANPISNAIALVILVFLLNYFHFGAKLLGYGIISIIGYCIFLVWLIATAPPGDNHIPEFGVGAVNLAASMGQAFSIQTFFIPVLRELPNTSKYVRITLISYIIGGGVYMYIAFAGSFGILNRIPMIGHPDTIEDYFQRGQWQMAIVEVIYLIHLYSAYGEFLLICKKRFFNICGIKESKHGQILNAYEIVFVFILIGITVGIFFGNVSISTLIQINGAILGFFFIYLLPAAMHFKCLYINWGNKNQLSIQMNKDTFDKDLLNRSTTKEPMIQLVDHSELPDKSVSAPALDFSNNLHFRETRLSTSNEVPMKKHDTVPVMLEVKVEEYVLQSCKCKKPKPLMQVVDLFFIIGMVALGAFIMVDGFIGIINEQKK